jgi:hypothetical protein
MNQPTSTPSFTSIIPLPTESVEPRLKIVGDELGEVRVVTSAVRCVLLSC